MATYYIRKYLKAISRGITYSAKQITRVAFDLALTGSLMFLFVSGQIFNFSNPVQLIGLKATLASLGFLHAHIIGKIAFPSVSWKDPNEDRMLKTLRIMLYVLFIYAYSHGG